MLLVPTLQRSSLFTSANKLENTVISAWMPISRPWTVTIRQCKRLIQATCQPAVSRPWIKGICCASVLPSLDAGFRHPCRKDGPPTLVYNDESRNLGTSQKSRNRGAARPCPLRGRAAPRFRGAPRRTCLAWLTTELGRNKSQCRSRGRRGRSCDGTQNGSPSRG